MSPRRDALACALACLLTYVLTYSGRPLRGGCRHPHAVSLLRARLLAPPPCGGYGAGATSTSIMVRGRRGLGAEASWRRGAAVQAALLVSCRQVGRGRLGAVAHGWPGARGRPVGGTTGARERPRNTLAHGRGARTPEEACLGLAQDSSGYNICFVSEGRCRSLSPCQPAHR